MFNLSKTMFTAMLTLSLAAATGCAVDADDDQAPAETEQTATEKLGTAREELIAGGGSSSGGGLWCKCKLACDNAKTEPPVTKACKKQCDDDNKCRKIVVGGGSSGIIMY